MSEVYWEEIAIIDLEDDPGDYEWIELKSSRYFSAEARFRQLPATLAAMWLFYEGSDYGVFLGDEQTQFVAIRASNGRVVRVEVSSRIEYEGKALAEDWIFGDSLEDKKGGE